jgi:uncharacterized repeat protein (TIGR04138 family)
MEDLKFEAVIESVRCRDPRYQGDAYVFVRQALDRTQKLANPSGKTGPHHVTGQQLLQGIREYALTQFGAMTVTVFEEWGIRQSSDFGEIVFNLIDAGFFSRTDQDERADFSSGLDFVEAFVLPFLPPSKLAALRAELKPVPA